MVYPKGHQKMLISCGEKSQLLFRIGIVPKGKRLLQGCSWSRESSGWAWKYPPYSQKNTCFSGLFILTLLLLLPCLSFIWHSHLQPQAHLTHKTKSCSNWAQFQQIRWLMCLKKFEFPVSVDAARNFFRLSSRLVIKTAQWFFVKSLLLRFLSCEQYKWYRWCPADFASCSSLGIQDCMLSIFGWFLFLVKS